MPMPTVQGYKLCQRRLRYGRRNFHDDFIWVARVNSAGSCSRVAFVGIRNLLLYNTMNNYPPGVTDKDIDPKPEMCVDCGELPQNGNGLCSECYVDKTPSAASAE